MIEFFNQKGIIHQKICVATPRQNEVAERKHQHLLNITRALKTQSNHPNIYWNDCILTAAHIINHVSGPLLSKTTPYELLFNSPNSYFHMRILGCLCFASSLSHIRTKFDSQGRSYVLLGYHFGIKCINSLTFILKQFLYQEMYPFINVFPFHQPNSFSAPLQLPHPFQALLPPFLLCLQL